MNKSLQLTVRQNKKDGTFEGIAQLEGSTRFKLTKSRSDETRFTTRSSLTQSAKMFAKRFGLELKVATPEVPSKKSVVVVKAKTTKSNKTTTKSLANDYNIS